MFEEAFRLDEICRREMRPPPDAPCPRCGYVSHRAPAWATFHVTFALNGKRYRIVSIGSTNRHAPRQMHFEDVIVCEPVEDRWQLPAAPCNASDVGVALAALNSLPRFRSQDLTSAYMIESP